MRGGGTRHFEPCDVAATELEQRDSLKVSSQSPYLLPSEGHGEVRQGEKKKKKEKRKKRHICVCCDLSVCQLACVRVCVKCVCGACVHLRVIYIGPHERVYVRFCTRANVRLSVYNRVQICKSGRKCVCVCVKACARVCVRVHVSADVHSPGEHV